MKKYILFFSCFLYTFPLFAGEGMWLPFLLKQVNEKEMRDMGLKITAEDIYSVNNGSLKDAVLIFGGGCTGEVISNQGLVLTNHHCGYGSVQRLSSVEHDYLTNGFFSKNKSEEMPCPGLSVTFIIRIDDATDAILKGVNDNMNDSTKEALIKINSEALTKSTKEKTGYDCFVRSFYYGNEYYLFLTEKFTDVRLVAFPPNGIGKFGGDTDNWVWPRHTGDFGVFRIYANAENKPAAYNINNKPFTPRKSFPINISGVKENDFTMVYGFPGRTTEYLNSDGVNEIMNILDPARIEIREKKLSIMDADMAKDKKTFIQYAAKQAGIANYYKKWKGELLGLQKNDAVNKKINEENQFLEWAKFQPEMTETYSYLFEDLKALYQSRKFSIEKNEYIREALLSNDLLSNASLASELMSKIDTLSTEKRLEFIKRNSDLLDQINLTTDKKIMFALCGLYNKRFGMINETSTEFLESIYKNSYLTSNERLAALLNNSDVNYIKEKLENDPLVLLKNKILEIQKPLVKEIAISEAKINKNYAIYLQGFKIFADENDLKIYPDANSTLRLTYGKVQGLPVQDGIQYSHFTTLKGAVAKRNTEVEEFNMPQRLVDLFEQKDFGNYEVMVNGEKTVPVCFLASNHTTGGNSGSPVINGNGELIGLNFDR
ncbi:MAG: S46 family peptidase, partial [Chitinophagaceae bacterium]|nr:S46 family peptidase [Chitinophagaceae bacterium]